MKSLPKINAALILGLFITCMAAGGTIEVVGPDTVDFGSYAASEKKTASYTIRNSGRDTLKILDIKKTCGCSIASCDRMELNPGERARVEVTIMPHSIAGPYSKNTFVESSDVSNRFLSLTVTGNAIPLVEVKPTDYVYAGRIPTNAPWTQSFEINGTSPGLVLGEPRTESSYQILTSLRQAGSNANSSYSLNVSLPQSPTSGDFKCSIVIPVLSPTNEPPLKVGIIGKIGPELITTPGIIRIPVSAQPIQKSFTMKILGDSTRILNAEELTLPGNQGVHCDVKQVIEGKGIAVTITFSPEFTQKLVAEETIPLIFAVPGVPPAELICKIRK